MSERGDRAMELGMEALRNGDPTAAREHFKVAARAYAQAGATSQQGNALRGVATTHQWLGQLSDARLVYEQARGCFRQVGDLSNESTVVFDLAGVCLEMRDRDAPGFFAEGTEIARRVGDHRRAAIGYRRLGEIATETSEYEQANKLLGRALEVASAAGITEELRNAQVSLGCLFEATGNYGVAIKAFAGAMTTTGDDEYPHSLPTISLHLGRAYHRNAQLDAAYEAYRSAIDSAKVVGGETEFHTQQLAATGLRQLAVDCQEVGATERAERALQLARSLPLELDV